jgi:hypothetical protein
MIDAFASGGDFHSRTAAGMFDYIQARLDAGTLAMDKMDPNYKDGMALVKVCKNTPCMSHEILTMLTLARLFVDYHRSSRCAPELQTEACTMCMVVAVFGFFAAMNSPTPRFSPVIHRLPLHCRTNSPARGAKPRFSTSASRTAKPSLASQRTSASAWTKRRTL